MSLPASEVKLPSSSVPPTPSAQLARKPPKNRDEGSLAVAERKNKASHSLKLVQTVLLQLR